MTDCTEETNQRRFPCTRRRSFWATPIYYVIASQSELLQAVSNYRNKLRFGLILFEMTPQQFVLRSLYSLHKHVDNNAFSTSKYKHTIFTCWIYQMKIFICVRYDTACVRLLADKKILMDKLQGIARFKLRSCIILRSWMEVSPFTGASGSQFSDYFLVLSFSVITHMCSNHLLNYLNSSCLIILIQNYTGNQEPFTILSWSSWSHSQLTHG